MVAVKRCTLCGENRPVTQFRKEPRSADGYEYRCRECLAMVAIKRRAARTAAERAHAISGMRRWRRSLKAEIIAGYGGKCQCCGESTSEFLTIDHINNDGALERRQYRAGYKFYSYLKRAGFPTDAYQLLCWNCNMAKGQFGMCPHQAAP